MKKPFRIALICVAATVVTAGLVLAGIVGVQRYRASQIPEGGISVLYVYTKGSFYTLGEYSRKELPEGYVQTSEISRDVSLLDERIKNPQEGDSNCYPIGTPIYTSPDEPDVIYIGLGLDGRRDLCYARFDYNDGFMTTGDLSDYSVYYVYTNETRYICREDDDPIELPEGFSETSKIARMPNRFNEESAQEGDSNIYPIGSPICTSPDDPDVIYVGVEVPSRTGKGKEILYVRFDREK